MIETIAEPFADSPDTTAAECEVRARKWVQTEKPLDNFRAPGRKRKRVDLNPLQQRWFEREGYTWARVEHSNAWGAVSVDLWGVFDYLAVREDVPGVLFVQVTTAPNVSARRKKILAAPELRAILGAGNRVQIHVWSQPAGPGTKWTITIIEIERDRP